MTERYAFYMSPETLKDRLTRVLDEEIKWGDNDLQHYAPSYNASPSTENPIVLSKGSVEIGLFAWGLVPSWADDDSKWELINGDSETVQEHDAFEAPFENRRCIVPAQGFFEWQNRDGGVSQPYRVIPENDPHDLFYLAGLYEEWSPSEQDQVQERQSTPDSAGFECRTYTILTKEAPGQLAGITGRMPVLLSQDNLMRWLNAEAQEAVKILERQKTSKPNIEKYPVDSEINDPTKDSASLISRDK